MKENQFDSYVASLARVLKSCAASNADNHGLSTEEAIAIMGRQMRACHANGKRVFFIGNGGGAGTASHMATDYIKHGGIRAFALNDSSFLTCIGNDYGYEHVFAKQLEYHAVAGDLVVAISSSGRSRNILNAVSAARARGCGVYTLS